MKRPLWMLPGWPFCVPVCFTSGSRYLKLTHMFCADLLRGEKAQERAAFRRSFNGGAAVGLFSLDNAYYGGHGHASFSCGFDGVDSGGACCANVIHNDYAGTLEAETLDPAASAVSLLSFADQEAVQQRCARMGECPPGAGRGHIGDDRVRAQGESAHRFGIDVIFL